MPKTHSEQYREAEATEQTRPAYGYIFEYQDEVFHLINHDQDVTVTGMPASLGDDPQVFTRSQAKHSSVDQKGDIGSSQMELTVGLGDTELGAVLRTYALRAVPDSILVTLVRFNSESMPGPLSWSTDKFVVFKGQATDVVFSGQTVTLPLLSLALQGSGKVPRFFYQLTCQHAFGDQKVGSCGLDIDTAEFRLETTLDAAARVGKYVDIPDVTLDANPILASTFPGGKLWVLDGWGDPVAKVGIVANELLDGAAGTRLYLAWWHPLVVAAADVKVFRGCNRTLAQCTSFGNQENFGGQPYTPVVNPVSNGIRV